MFGAKSREWEKKEIKSEISFDECFSVQKAERGDGLKKKQ